MTHNDLDMTLQLLVDDELDEAERAGLIDRLSRTPDGWQRCATAFIEAQQIERALREQEEPKRWAIAGAWRITGLAAALLIAAWIGWSMPRSGAIEPSSPEDPQQLLAQLASDPTFVVNPNDEIQPIVFEHLRLDGRSWYTTRQPMPRFMLQAISDAGHGVLLHRRNVTVTGDDGTNTEIPIIETHIAQAGEIRL